MSTCQGLAAEWHEILPYYLSPFGLLVSIAWYSYFGNFLAIFWLTYVFIPVLDVLIPPNAKNLPKERAVAWEKDDRFLHPVYLLWILDFGFSFYILYQVSTEKVGQTWP